MITPRALMLRPARQADAPVMADMCRTLIEAGLTWRYTPPRMAAMIRDPDTVALVACDGPQLHGFAVMHFGDALARLALLCVVATQQRQGLGRQLHHWLLASAQVAGGRWQVAGGSTLRLELRADNSSALSFYRQLGFLETQRLPNDDDGLVAARRMELRLQTVR